MHDRLAELAGSKVNPFVKDGQIQLDIQTEQINKPKCMEQFFAISESVEIQISHIRQSTNDIVELNRQVINATSSHEETAISDKLHQVIDSANKSAATAKGELEKIKKANAEKKNDKSSDPSENRMRQNMYMKLTKSFMEAMKEYQEAQQDYKDGIKSKVKRQVQIVKPDATSEEIDMMMRSADAGAVYKTAILQGTADPIKEAFVNCQDKYQDVLRLEQSVTELHQMFLDLALLVEQQGEMLDQIESQVKSAHDYIESANEEVSKAIRSQSSAR